MVENDEVSKINANVVNIAEPVPESANVTYKFWSEALIGQNPVAAIHKLNWRRLDVNCCAYNDLFEHSWNLFTITSLC